MNKKSKPVKVEVTKNPIRVKTFRNERDINNWLLENKVELEQPIQMSLAAAHNGSKREHSASGEYGGFSTVQSFMIVYREL